MNKEITKDSITGAIFDHIEVNWGQHWTNEQDVVQVKLKQDADSNSTNIYVLSEKSARSLQAALGIALNNLAKI
jgi:hypothetical protein